MPEFGSLRKPESGAIYEWDKQSGKHIPLVDEKAIKDFKLWRVVENRYPYDLVFSVCHIVVPKRNFIYHHEMTLAENAEYREDIYPWAQEAYDTIMENTVPRRSQKTIFHIHLLKY